MNLEILLHADRIEVRLHHTPSFSPLFCGLLRRILDRSRLLLTSRIPKVEAIPLRNGSMLGRAFVPVHADGSTDIEAFWEPLLRSLTKEARDLGFEVKLRPYSEDVDLFVPREPGP